MVLQIAAALLLAASSLAGSAEQAGQLARKTLAQELGIAEDHIRVQGVAATEWPDVSLGCPDKGRQYMQVLTPGHRVTLEAEGKTYEIHVAGARAVRCGSAPGAPGGERNLVAAARLSELAREDLAARLKIGKDAVKANFVRPQTWPDSSLGCPRPGATYAQVVTPGFLIELEAGGKTYRYHADLQRIVQCE